MSNERKIVGSSVSLYYARDSRVIFHIFMSDFASQWYKRFEEWNTFPLYYYPHNIIANSSCRHLDRKVWTFCRRQTFCIISNFLCSFVLSLSLSCAPNRGDCFVSILLLLSAVIYLDSYAFINSDNAGCYKNRLFGAKISLEFILYAYI